MIRLRRASASALAILALTGAPAHPASDGCGDGRTRVDSVSRVERRGELVLASGARAVLAGLRWPEAPEVGAAARGWLAVHQARPLALTVRAGEDRWGRLRVDAVTTEAPLVDLAGGLIAAGLAHADAGELDRLCRPGLLALEAEPRAAGRGVWVAPVRAALDPNLEEAAGRFLVAEGRIRHVGEARRRTYLNFAARGAAGLTVTVSKRTWRIMTERGFTAASLRGRRVRVRGVLEVRRGPMLDIASADMIEVLDEERAPRR